MRGHSLALLTLGIVVGATLAGCMTDHESIATLYVTGSIRTEWTSDAPHPWPDPSPTICGQMPPGWNLNRTIPEIRFVKGYEGAPVPGDVLVIATDVWVDNEKFNPCGPHFLLKSTDEASGYYRLTAWARDDFSTEFRYEVLEDGILINGTMLRTGDSIDIDVDHQGEQQRYYGTITVEYLGKWKPSQFVPVESGRV